MSPKRTVEVVSTREEPEANRAGSKRPSRSNPRKPWQSSRVANEFTRTVERTVDALKGDVMGDGFEDVRRILAEIRRQFDEVHCEADKKEAELMHIRREIRLIEAEADPQPPEAREYASISTAGLQRRLSEVSKEMDSACETRRVYQHMVERLRRELQVVQQKVSIMQRHLRRKTNEVGKRQDLSRRVHQDKVASINRLEEVEQEIELERQVCSAALTDLDESVKQKRSEVTHREEFERWRYEIAKDAANEAFQATAGRYRKIYAVEKLTGNCLQRITYEQAEQSQATEDGFQKIREVTGLTDVMDIVHKFLNRDTEHEQLRMAVREAEVKLHSLREAEAARHGEGPVEFLDDLPPRPRGLAQEVATQEQELLKAQREYQDFQLRLQAGTLMFNSIMEWGRRIAKSLAAVEELPPVDVQPDIVPFFSGLAGAVDRLFTKAQEDYPLPKLSKMAGQASLKEHTEQQRLLGDKDFMRLNLRVAAALDQRNPADEQRKHRGGGGGGGAGGPGAQNVDEEMEYAAERDRLKGEARTKFSERAPARGEKEARRERERQQLLAAEDAGRHGEGRRASRVSGGGQATEATQGAGRAGGTIRAKSAGGGGRPQVAALQGTPRGPSPYRKM